MTPTRESEKAPSAESIALMADRGEDVSRSFTNCGRMMQPVQQVKAHAPGTRPGDGVET
jgi:hypothetical protein